MRARATYVDTNYIEFNIPIPVYMRANPVIVGTEGTNWAIYSTTSAWIRGFSLSAQLNGCGITLRATKTAHGLSDAMFSNTSSGAVYLDARI